METRPLPRGVYGKPGEKPHLGEAVSKHRRDGEIPKRLGGRGQGRCQEEVTSEDRIGDCVGGGLEGGKVGSIETS